METRSCKVPTIIPITDLRQDAATVLRQVRDSKEPIVITQRGRPELARHRDNPEEAHSEPMGSAEAVPARLTLRVGHGLDMDRLTDS